MKIHMSLLVMYFSHQESPLFKVKISLRKTNWVRESAQVLKPLPNPMILIDINEPKILGKKYVSPPCPSHNPVNQGSLVNFSFQFELDWNIYCLQHIH